MPAYWVYGAFALAIVVCCWALWRGGPVERIGAATILSAWCLTLMMPPPEPGQPGLAVLAIDIVTLIILATLSVKSRRLWTVFATAFQLDAVTSSFITIITGFDGWSYVTGLGVLSGEGLLISLAAGVLGKEYERRLQKRLQVSV